MKLRKRSALLSLAVTGALCASAQGQAISVDWFGAGGGGGTTAPIMDATETAGVIPLANWNSFTGNVQATPQALKDSTGATTTATATWTSQGTWNTGIDGAVSSNAKMMKGYLDTGDATPTPPAIGKTTVTISGLPAATEPWAVIVYFDGDTGENRVGEYSISGATTGNATFWGRNAGGAANRFNGTFIPAQTPIDPLLAGGNVDSNNAAAATVPAGNYMIFPGITGSGFEIGAQADVSAGATNRAPLNGIQIVPMSQVPEPGALTFVGVACAGLLSRRRKH
jgi:hypothetical protein